MLPVVEKQILKNQYIHLWYRFANKMLHKHSTCIRNCEKISYTRRVFAIVKRYRINMVRMVLVFLFAQIDMEHTALIWHLFNNGVSLSCSGVAIIRVWAAYVRVWAAIIRVRAAYTPRMLGACTAHLPRTYCVIMYARRSRTAIFFNMFKIWWRT